MVCRAPAGEAAVPELFYHVRAEEVSGGKETTGSGGRAGGGVCVVTALCPLALAQYGVSKGVLLHPLTREPLNGTPQMVL
jgi:hypothetical protein